MFFVYVFSIWATVITHVFYRAQGLFGIGGKARLVLGSVFYLLGFAYIPARILIRMEPSDGFARILALGAAFFIGLVAILWTLLVLVEIVAAFLWLVKRLRVKNAPRGWCRILAAVWWSTAGILTVVGIVSAHATPSVTRMEVSVPGAAPGRFVVISDTHLGAISDVDQWRRTLRAAKELDPNALLIPGDLIDDRSRRGEEQVAMIREFFPKRPVYIVTGNHEGYVGLDFFETLCRRLQFRLLRQENELLLPGLHVVGIDDARGKTDLRAVDGLLPDDQGAVLLLAHRPEVAHLLEDRDMTLVLAGHTHGGQTLPMVFLVALGNGGFSSGYYRVGQAHLYVSRGAGVWGPPLRLLAPPELVLIDVRPGLKFDVQIRM